jgi:ORF6N domain
MNTQAVIPSERIEGAILLVQGQKVMLDRDLAALYGVTTGNLNKAVQRNLIRFPADFMFQLTADEAASLSFQSGSLKRGAHFKYLPDAFTEQGVAMLSSVLRSPRAVQVNIAIMRAFVRLRELLLSNADLARKLAELEAKCDSQFKVVFEAIRQLMAPPAAPPKPDIGFHVKEDAHPYRTDKSRTKKISLASFLKGRGVFQNGKSPRRRDRKQDYELPAEPCQSRFQIVNR